MSDELDVRALAAGVIRQAWLDARTGPTGQRQMARGWLLSPHNTDRQFWSHVAGADDEHVVQAARRTLDQQVS